MKPVQRCNGSDETVAMPPTCRYRVVARPCGPYFCRHRAVRARQGIVPAQICLNCALASTLCAEPRPLTAETIRLLTGAADRRGDGRLRVGFVTPNLVMGGAERWIINLLRYLDPARIVPAGVALLNAAPADPAMCAEAAESAPIFGGPDGRTEFIPFAGLDSRTEFIPFAGLDGRTEFNPFDGRGTDGEPERNQFGLTVDERNEFRSTRVIRFGSVDEALEALCQQADVIVAWGSSHFARLMAARRFAGEVVIVAHGSAASTVRMLEAGKADAHYLVGVSQAAAAAFRDPRAVVIHNGADQARCAATVPRAETRRQWGAARGDVLLGYVGRFSWEKNPLAAALAATELNAAQSRPHRGALPNGNGGRFRAVYIGGGADEDAVKAKARAIAPNSIFVPPVEQIGNALNALDVFVLASPSEGFSLALAEAWLCGVPAVATRVGAVPELEALHGQMVVGVRDGASPGELAAAVRRALGPEGRAIAERAKRVACERYTAKAMAERWEEFLLGMMAKR